MKTNTRRFTQNFENTLTRAGEQLISTFRPDGEIIVRLRNFEDTYAVLRTRNVEEARAHWTKLQNRVLAGVNNVKKGPVYTDLFTS